MTRALPLLLILLALVALGVALSLLRRVPAGQAGVVERLSRHHRTLRSGLHFLLPGDTIRRVDLGEQLIRLPAVPLVSRDRQALLAEADLSYRVVDPRAASYEIGDYALGVEQTLRGVLRNQADTIDAEMLLDGGPQVAERFRQVLDDAVAKWGIKTIRLDVTVQPGRDR